MEMPPLRGGILSRSRPARFASHCATTGREYCNLRCNYSRKRKGKVSTCFVDSPFLRSLTPHFCVFLNRYIALFNKMQQKKRNRELTRQGIDASVVETQEVVAASLQGSHSKKLCVGGSILNLLGAEAIGRSHTRLVPKQMAIDAALSRTRPFSKATMRTMVTSLLRRSRSLVTITRWWRRKRMPWTGP